VNLRDPAEVTSGGLSPTLQRERIEAWATVHGHDIADLVEDLDVSGGREDRDNLTHLVERVEAGELDGLAVATLDRFGRSLPYCIALIDRIHRAGGQFVSVADGFDTRTPYGELALNVMLSVAQFELRRIREQWQVVVARNIRAGRHPGAVPPFGYDRAADGRLVPGEHAGRVTELFARYAVGESLSSLARWLNGLGVRTQTEGPVTRRFLHRILTSRAYLGEARFGEMVNAQAHEPLVTSEVFARVARRGFGPRPARGGQPAVLAGLVRCQGCRYAMAPVMRDGKRRYRCLGVQQGRKCPAPAFVTQDELLPAVMAEFWRRLGDVQAVARESRERLDALRAVRDDAVAELAAYRDDTVIAAVGAHVYADGLRERQRRADNADATLEREIANRPDALPDASLLSEHWDDLDDATRRSMLAAMFSVVVVRKHPSRSRRLPIGRRVRFMGVGEVGVDELPRSGVRREVPLPPFAWPDGDG